MSRSKCKTEEEIEILRRNNILVSKTLAEVAKLIKPGVTTEELDKRAEEFIRDNNAVPGFLGYMGFPKSLCTSVNDEVVHGIPSEYTLKEGDILSVDCGTILDGFYGDSAFTFAVGEVDPEWLHLMQITKESLEKGVEMAVAGNRIGDIGHVVQEHAEGSGFSVVREMVGHGLGQSMHEAPEIPNYGKRGHGSKLKTGMVICIEPMINMGSRKIYQRKNKWTIATQDGKPSAHYEYAVAVGKDQPDILTTYKYIYEVINK